MRADLTSWMEFKMQISANIKFGTPYDFLMDCITVFATPKLASHFWISSTYEMIWILIITMIAACHLQFPFTEREQEIHTCEEQCVNLRTRVVHLHHLMKDGTRKLRMLNTAPDTHTSTPHLGEEDCNESMWRWSVLCILTKYYSDACNTQLCSGIHLSAHEK